MTDQSPQPEVKAPVGCMLTVMVVAVLVVISAVWLNSGINSPEPDKRIAVLAKTNDQRLIGRVARGDNDERVRQFALAKLTDPAGLCGVITYSEHDERQNIRMTAVNKLEDSTQLERAAEGTFPLGRPAWDRIAAEVHLKLALLEPIVVRHLGRVRVEGACDFDSESYYEGPYGVGRSHTLYREIVTLRLVRGDSVLAERTWKPDFPQGAGNFQGVWDAKVRGEELLADLLRTRGFTAPELAELAKSRIVEVRAAVDSVRVAGVARR